MMMRRRFLRVSWYAIVSSVRAHERDDGVPGVRRLLAPHGGCRVPLDVLRPASVPRAVQHHL